MAIALPVVLPFMLAPVGVQGIVHAEAELATARAAAATRTPMIVSSAASTPMEAISAAMGETPRWFQLYWVSDRDVVESLVRRAERKHIVADQRRHRHQPDGDAIDDVQLLGAGIEHVRLVGGQRHDHHHGAAV